MLKLYSISSERSALSKIPQNGCLDFDVIKTDFEKIENEGLIGGKTISIVIGKSKVKLDSKSIIKLKKETSLFQNDSVKSKIENRA